MGEYRGENAKDPLPSSWEWGVSTWNLLPVLAGDVN